MTQEQYMRRAIEQAQKALQLNEGMGFGAIIVKDGEIISEAHNSVLANIDPTSHGEVNAIRSASKKLNSSDLSGCVLYSTCEPCPMCFTASWWAGVSKIVFGVSLEDVTNVSREMLVSSEFLNEKGGLTIEIEAGFLKEECMVLYQNI